MEVTGSTDQRLDWDGDNTFNILVATDIHLGYKHQDPVMGNDSINTFQEVLQIAQDRQVDFVLLGGDLFHDNSPPRHFLYNSLQLLKRYCLGERRPKFEMAKEPTPSVDNDDTCEDTAHWNVSMPVFSIHGNHDEPAGPGYLSVMDLLHSSGLVQYFGKTFSLEDIRLEPLLLTKGSTRLALYGVGSIRSNKLQKMLNNNRVNLERPQEDRESWFNVFVLHQNRGTNRGNTHVEEASIHGFLDLVIWGHEHESKIKPVKLDGKGGKYWLSQPGSTIATEFKKAEMKQKHVGLLRVQGKRFEMRRIPLKTVRQMVIEDHVPEFVLDEASSAADEKRAMNTLLEDCHLTVERVLKDAEKTRGPQQPKEPLIRIRIRQQQQMLVCSSFRFGIRYTGRVANPESILAFGKRTNVDEDSAVDFSFPSNPHGPIFSVHELLRMQLCEKPLNLQIMQATDLLHAVEKFVDWQDKHSIKQAIEGHLKNVQESLKRAVPRLSSSQHQGGGVSGSVPSRQNTEDFITVTEDSDEELTQSIDQLSQQFADENQGNADTLGLPTPQWGGASDGPKRAPVAAHSGAAADFVPPEDEAWLSPEEEDDFFDTPSTSRQSAPMATFSRIDELHQKKQSSSQDIPIMIVDSDSSSSNDDEDSSSATSGLHQRPPSVSGLHQRPSSVSGIPRKRPKVQERDV